MNPSEFMAKLRETGLPALRRAKAEVEELEKKAGAKIQVAPETLHIHPSDDPWTRTCRTICGKVVPVQQAIAPRSVSRFSVFDLAGCHDCWAIWSAWRITGNGKPLTYRRLSLWPAKNLETETILDATTKTEKKTNARAKALHRAMEARRRELGRYPEEDSIYTFLGELLIEEQAAITSDRPPGNYKAGGETHIARTRVKLMMVDLIRMKPSTAVLRALQGV